MIILAYPGYAIFTTRPIVTTSVVVVSVPCPTILPSAPVGFWQILSYRTLTPFF